VDELDRMRMRVDGECVLGLDQLLLDLLRKLVRARTSEFWRVGEHVDVADRVARDDAAQVAPSDEDAARIFLHHLDQDVGQLAHSQQEIVVGKFVHRFSFTRLYSHRARRGSSWPAPRR